MYAALQCTQAVMARPENGIYIVMGEINLVVTAMRRSSRWGSHSHHVSLFL